MDDQTLFSSSPGNVPAPSPSSATFAGNNYDLMAAIGLIFGITVLASCFTLNLAYYCLPVVAVVLGVIALTNANRATDPARTRTYAWIAIGTGGFILLLVMALVVFYLVVFGFALADPNAFN